MCDLKRRPIVYFHNFVYFLLHLLSPVKGVIWISDTRYPLFSKNRRAKLESLISNLDWEKPPQRLDLWIRFRKFSKNRLRRSESVISQNNVRPSLSRFRIQIFILKTLRISQKVALRNYCSDFWYLLPIVSNREFSVFDKQENVISNVNRCFFQKWLFFEKKYFFIKSFFQKILQ